ncbi:MAG: hypothetical protein JO317_03545 [Verrucomicrobiae bacterium]|nr:hypothetical protein [Verrucomicrobiae bacterium]
MFQFIFRFQRRLIPIFALAALFVGFASRPVFAASPILPLKEVTPGMAGECRTVFQGTKIETFRFRVEGVGWDDVGPGRDTIWCRMLDDPTGSMVVAAGMSGSPCYVDGKLMGALAYGWSFNKEPLFGVQPIESMMDVPKDYGGLAGAKGSDRSISGGDGNEGAGGGTGWSMMSMGNVLGKLLRRPPETELPLPIQISRLHPRLARLIMPTWKKDGLTAMEAVGGTSRKTFRAELVPGAAAAGVLARGDFSATATGTLTWRDGDQVLAFGHPFTGLGKVNIPLAESEIIAVVSSYEHSFKMSNTGQIVGTLTDDRISAVAGKVGPKPRMIPLSMKVKYPTAEKEFHFEMADEKMFAPRVFEAGVLNFLAEVMERSGDATVRLTGTIHLKDHPPVTLKRLVSGEDFAWVADLAADTGDEINALYLNDLVKFQIESIDVKAEVDPTYRHWKIEELEVFPKEAHPGETVEGWVALRPPRDQRRTVPFKIKIPEETRPGDLEIRVSDSHGADEMEGRFMGFAVNKPHSADELIRILNERHESNKLYFYAVQDSPGYVLRNQRMPSLPGSIRELLDDEPGRREVQPIHEAHVVKMARELDGTVEGRKSFKITIK